MRKRTNTRTMILCALFTTLLVLCAYLRIPIGEVPITLQSLAVLLTAMLLGPLQGTASVSVYILLGLVGLPIFTSGGGIGAVLSPTFGFVLGFLPMALLTGYFSRSGHGLRRNFLAAILGTLALYSIGILYGYFILNIYMGKGITIGALVWSYVVLFIPIDLLKCVLAAAISVRLSPILNKY